jgi:hypothetical protein
MEVIMPEPEHSAAISSFFKITSFLEVMPIALFILMADEFGYLKEIW